MRFIIIDTKNQLLIGGDFSRSIFRGLLAFGYSYHLKIIHHSLFQQLLRKQT